MAVFSVIFAAMFLAALAYLVWAVAGGRDLQGRGEVADAPELPPCGVRCAPGAHRGADHRGHCRAGEAVPDFTTPEDPMNSILTTVSIVTGISYTVCVLVAMPPLRWTIPVQKVAIALAAITCVLDFVTRAWVGGVIFAALVVVATLILVSKRRTLQLRESLRRWDA